MTERPRLTLVKPDAGLAALEGFLRDLTALSDRYGIAVNDGAELYEMEPEDRLFIYRADAESRLSRA